MTPNFRRPPLRDPAYRKSAQHRHCMVRHPETGEFCNGDGVVLCHINIAGNFGMKQKAPDDESVFLCRFHHDEFDGRSAWTEHARDRWLVRNILIPQRKAYYRKYRSETGR